MMTMNKNYIKLAALAAIGIGGYLIIRNLLAKSVTPAAESASPNMPSDIATSDFPIQKGNKGAKVKEIQRLLIAINPNALPKYGVDGDFGSETEAAVFKYLNKKSVDNQEDITNLNGIKDAAQANALQNSVDANRNIAANQIIASWKANPVKSLYAKDITQIATGSLSFSGQEMNLSTRNVVTNAIIVNGFEIKDISVLPSGFLKIFTTSGGLNGGFIKVSPFAVVLK